MSEPIELKDGYYNIDCASCGRMRVEADGFCEKCGFDNNDYIRSRQHSQGQS
jgi:hypothetical protein